MIVIDYKTNMDAFAAKLDDVKRRQVPYATAMALNALIARVQKAEIANEKAVLDRPRPFTTGATRILKARSDSLTARLVMLDLTASYLDPYEKGGTNKLNSDALLKPADEKTRLDQFGNLPRRRMAQLALREDVFIGKVKTKIGDVSGVWQRVTDEGHQLTMGQIKIARVNPKTGKVTVVTVRADRKLARNTGYRLKLLIKFTDAHPIDDKNRLHWAELAAKTINGQFRKEFGRQLGRALATAK